MVFADYLRLALINIIDIGYNLEVSKPLASSAGAKKLIIRVCAAKLTEVPMEHSQLNKLFLSDDSIYLLSL